MIFSPSDMDSVPAFDQLKLLEPCCGWQRHWPASLLSSTANQLKIPKASLYWIQNTNPSFSVTGVFKAATFVPILSLVDWRGYMWKCVCVRPLCFLSLHACLRLHWRQRCHFLRQHQAPPTGRGSSPSLSISIKYGLPSQSHAQSQPHQWSKAHYLQISLSWFTSTAAGKV